MPVLGAARAVGTPAPSRRAARVGGRTSIEAAFSRRSSRTPACADLRPSSGLCAIRTPSPINSGERNRRGRDLLTGDRGGPAPETFPTAASVPRVASPASLYVPSAAPEDVAAGGAGGARPLMARVSMSCRQALSRSAAVLLMFRAMVKRMRPTGSDALPTPPGQAVRRLPEQRLSAAGRRDQILCGRNARHNRRRYHVLYRQGEPAVQPHAFDRYGVGRSHVQRRLFRDRRGSIGHVRFAALRSRQGFRDVSSSLAAKYAVSRHIFVLAAAGARGILGKDADSPIIEHKWQPLGSLGLAYAF